MSTFKQICESVLEEVNGRGDELSSVDLGRDGNGDLYVTDPTERNVIRWVGDLYVQMQQIYLQADFMHTKGKFLTTIPGQRVYSKAGVRTVNNGSMYAVRSTGSAKFPIRVKTYQDWVVQEQSGSTTETTGTPVELFEMPEESWVIYPTPTEVWEIWGEWWRLPTEFFGEDDEPIWDSPFHDILKWRALLLLATEFVEEGATNVLVERVKLMLPQLERAFKKRYIPPITGPEAM